MKKTILAENTPLEQVTKLRIAIWNWAGKNATRLNGRRYSSDGDAEKIAASEEQVRALSVKNKVAKIIKCKTFTKPFHAPRKCKGVEQT